MLDVADLLGPTGQGDASQMLERVVRLSFGGALVSAVIVGALAAWESRRPPRPSTQDALRLGGRVAAAAVLVSVLVVAVVAVGNPVTRVENGWDSFKGGYGDNAASGSRLVGGLGSNRYDFYRVGLNEFRDAPVFGQGGGAFQQAYLREGSSTETPRYPHSIELRALSEYGLVGALMLLVALGGAAAAAIAGLRAGGPLARAVITGALGTVLYWLVHGSADWFWEFAGLGGPAFALLGVVCALAPRPDPPRSAPLRLRTPVELAGVGLGLLALALLVLGPWAASRETEAAARVFAARPLESFSRLDRAADARSVQRRSGAARWAASRFATAISRGPKPSSPAPSRASPTVSTRPSSSGPSPRCAATASGRFACWGGRFGSRRRTVSPSRPSPWFATAASWTFRRCPGRS